MVTTSLHYVPQKTIDIILFCRFLLKATLYKVFLIISMFISSKSCSEMHSTKKGAAKKVSDLELAI